jgi:hypothetical protein
LPLPLLAALGVHRRFGPSLYFLSRSSRNGALVTVHPHAFSVGDTANVDESQIFDSCFAILATGRPDCLSGVNGRLGPAEPFFSSRWEVTTGFKSKLIRVPPASATLEGVATAFPRG